MAVGRPRLIFNIMAIYYSIPDVAAALNHLSELTGVECQIHEMPPLKALGLFSLTTSSEDLVRVAAKYGIVESPVRALPAFSRQFLRVIDKLSAMGVFNRSEFDPYIVATERP